MERGPGFIPTFLYYFVGTTLIVALVVSQQSDLSLASPAPYQAGILFGLIAGLSGAYFNRHFTISVPFKTSQDFNKTLTGILNQMGFVEQTTVDDYTIYQRSSLSKLFSVRIFVQMDKDTATISGRSTNIKELQKRLQAASVIPTNQ